MPNDLSRTTPVDVHSELDGLSVDDHSIYVFNNPGSNARNVIQPAADFIPLTIKANASQTESLLDFKNSSNATIAYVSSTGAGVFPSLTVWGSAFTSITTNATGNTGVVFPDIGGTIALVDGTTTTTTHALFGTASAGQYIARAIVAGDLPAGLLDASVIIAPGTTNRNRITPTANSINVFGVQNHNTSDNVLLKIENKAGQFMLQAGVVTGSSYTAVRKLAIADYNITFYDTSTGAFAIGVGSITMNWFVGRNTGTINTSATSTADGGSLSLHAVGSNAGGSITTSNGGGSITTNGASGSIQLGVSGTRTTISGSGVTCTQTLPTVTGTLLNTTTAATIATGVKTFNAATFRLGGAGAGFSTLAYANSASSFTHTFPAVTGTVALLSGTQTFAGANTFSSTFNLTGISSSVQANSLQFNSATGAVTFTPVDGDKGDVTVSASGATFTVDNNVISYAKMQQSSVGFTVLSKASTGAGNYAELAAGVDSVLRRSGSGDLAFGTLVTNNLGNSVVTLAKLANAVASSKLLGSGASGSGSPYVELTIGSGLTMTGTTLSSSGGGGTPGGSNTQVQFNDSSAFGGDAGLTYDKTNDMLSVPSINMDTGAGGHGVILGSIRFDSNSSLRLYVTGGGVENLFWGSQAGGIDGSGNTTQTTGVGYNVGIGNQSLFRLTSGYANTCLGNTAGNNITTGFENTLFGSGAGLTITTGSTNTCIGTGAEVNSATATNRTALGYGASSNENNVVAIGNSSANIVLGGTTARAKLDVRAGAIIVDEISIPTAVSNTVQIYAYDNAGETELHALSGVGNPVVLLPHAYTRRRYFAVMANGDVTNRSVSGMAAMTVVTPGAGIISQDDSTGIFQRLTSANPGGSPASLSTGDFYRLGWKPDVACRFKTGTGTSGATVFIGFAEGSIDFDTSGYDPTGIGGGVYLCYDSDVHGTAFFRAIENIDSGSTAVITTTTLAVTDSTEYLIRFETLTNGNVLIYNKGVLVHTCTAANIPVANTKMYFIVGTASRTAAANRDFSFSWYQGSHN